MIERVFVIAFGNEILGKTPTWDEAYIYLTKSFGEKAINIDNYNCFGQGKLDEWTYFDNPKIRIINLPKGEVEVEKILEDLDDNKSKNETIRLPSPEKPIRCNVTTPTRTRLKVKNTKNPLADASKLKEGTIKKSSDGTKWIVKRMKNGGAKWTRYYEETHDGLERKRKSPKLKAKEYEEGTVMDGEDGNRWIVKKVKDNTFKWVKYND